MTHQTVIDQPRLAALLHAFPIPNQLPRLDVVRHLSAAISCQVNPFGNE